MAKPTIAEVKQKVNESLDRAEKVWKKVEVHFMNENLRKALNINELSSQIPGHAIVIDGKPEVTNFVALVLDIRGSTDHLTQAFANGTSQLERVLYETTAVNTIGQLVVESYSGKITEFLGDGFLALYNAGEDEDANTVYLAHNSAKFLINEALGVVNEILKERYAIPALKIGIGMAYGKAIVTVMGYGNNLQPKALGECVYRASKLSDGVNVIQIDERLKKLWPKSSGGQLQFIAINKKQKFSSYEIRNK